MKRQAIAWMVLAFATALVPQALDAGVGIKGGFSLSKLSETPTYAWENLPFFAGGLSFEGGFGYISLQPEVLYVRMGGKDPAGDLECRFNYIQVPVLLKINIVPAGPVRPFVFGGGYGSYLVKAESVIGAVKTDQTENYERYDYGLVGGAGLAFKMAVLAVSVEGRYNYGLKNIMKEPGLGESMKNRCLMALVGIRF